MTCDTELWDHLFHVQSGIELSNMGLERMLARFRKCAPGKHPLIERIASAGTLSQFLASHRAAGGKHPLERQRSSLLAAGVHLKVRSKFQKGRPQVTRQRPLCSIAVQGYARNIVDALCNTIRCILTHP